MVDNELVNGQISTLLQQLSDSCIILLFCDDLNDFVFLDWLYNAAMLYYTITIFSNLLELQNNTSAPQPSPGPVDRSRCAGPLSSEPP